MPALPGGPPAAVPLVENPYVTRPYRLEQMRDRPFDRPQLLEAAKRLELGEGPEAAPRSPVGISLGVGLACVGPGDGGATGDRGRIPQDDGAASEMTTPFRRMAAPFLRWGRRSAGWGGRSAGSEMAPRSGGGAPQDEKASPWMTAALRRLRNRAAISR